MKEEPELDSSNTGRFLVELFRQKGRVPAEKMINKMGKMMAKTIVMAAAAMTASAATSGGSSNLQLKFGIGEVI